MKYKEFLEYLELNLEGYKTFMNKARQYQITKNLKRPAKNRWLDDKMEKAAYEMWKKSMESLYTHFMVTIPLQSFGHSPFLIGCFPVLLQPFLKFL